MTPSEQMRLGWLTVTVTIGIGILLQSTVQAFWFYRPHPASKVGGVILEPMIIWPCVVPLLLPIVTGLILVCRGYYRRAQSRRSPDEASSAGRGATTGY